MSAVAGRVLIIPKGAYVAGTTYNMLDLVKYNSKSFLAKRTNTNVTPVDGADWMELTNDGVTSFNGRSGAVNPANGDYNMTNLGDVNLTTPTDGQGLRYNSQTGKWENGDAASAVDNLTDVDLTNLANNQILKYNATAQKWENADEKGHTIQNASGTAQTQRANMQFPDSHVSDDETNGRTVVESIKNITKADLENVTEDGIYQTTDEEDVPIGDIEEDSVSVTADGVKTYAQLLNDIFNDQSYDWTKVDKKTAKLEFGEEALSCLYVNSYSISFGGNGGSEGNYEIEDAILIKTNYSTYDRWITATNGSVTYAPISSNVPVSGTKFTLYYGTSSTIINLKTDARDCMMSDGVTSVESEIKGAKGGLSVNSTYISVESVLYNGYSRSGSMHNISGQITTTQAVPVQTTLVYPPLAKYMPDKIIGLYLQGSNGVVYPFGFSTSMGLYSDIAIPSGVSFRLNFSWYKDYVTA